METQQENKQEYLYILHNKHFDVDGPDMLYKFGRTKNIFRRIRDSSYNTSFRYLPRYKAFFIILGDTRKIEKDIKNDLAEYVPPQSAGTEMYQISFEMLRKYIVSYLTNQSIEFSEYIGTAIDKYFEHDVIPEEDRDKGRYILQLVNRDIDCNECGKPFRHEKIFCVCNQMFPAESHDHKISYYHKKCAKLNEHNIGEFNIVSNADYEKFRKIITTKDALTSVLLKLDKSAIDENDPFVLLHGLRKDPADIEKKYEAICNEYPEEQNSRSKYKTLAFVKHYLVNKRKYKEKIDVVHDALTTKKKYREYLINTDLLHDIDEDLLSSLNMKISDGCYVLSKYEKIENDFMQIVTEINGNKKRGSADMDWVQSEGGEIIYQPDDLQKLYESPVSYVNGCAGSGKSTLIAYSSESFCKNDYQIICTAPTALAAITVYDKFRGIIEKNGYKVFAGDNPPAERNIHAKYVQMDWVTLHSLWKLINGKDIIDEDNSSENNKKSRLRDNILIVIDEVSMVSFNGVKQLNHFLAEVICKMGIKNITMIFAGDHKQLEPIGVGSIIDLLDKLRSNINVIELDYNHRTKSDKMRNMLRHLRDDGYLSEPDGFSESGHSFAIIEEKNMNKEFYERLDWSDHFSGETITIIPNNKKREEVNQIISRKYNGDQPGTAIKLKGYDKWIRKGDKVMITTNKKTEFIATEYINTQTNNYIGTFNDKMVCNGQIFRVVDIIDRTRLISGYEMKKYEKKYLFSSSVNSSYRNYRLKCHNIEYECYVNKCSAELKLKLCKRELFKNNAKKSRNSAKPSDSEINDWFGSEYSDDIKNYDAFLRNFKSYSVVLIEVGSKERMLLIKSYCPEFDDYLDICYCITIHKSQGASKNNVRIIIDPNTREYSLNDKQLYTAMSRCRKKCEVIIYDKKIIDKFAARKYREKLIEFYDDLQDIAASRGFHSGIVETVRNNIIFRDKYHMSRSQYDNLEKVCSYNRDARKFYKRIIEWIGKNLIS